MASNFNIQDASVQNLFKTKYNEKSLNTYNGKVPILGLVKKTHNLVGEKQERSIPTGYQGGAGSGTLPVANRGIYIKPQITSKSIYCVCEVDRRTIKLSKNEGAFVDGLKEPVKKTVEKFNWNASRMMLNDLVNGSLGTLESVSAVGGATYDIVITAATWKLANWEIRDFINIESGNTDLFEITAVTNASRTVRVVRITGSQVPEAADLAYLQGSEDNDIFSTARNIAATSGNLYGVPVGFRWQSPVQKDAEAAGVTSDLLNFLMLGVEESVGETPNLMLTSYTQLRKLLNSIEGDKYYNVTTLAPRAKNLQGVISFSAIQFASTAGPVPIIVDRFVRPDGFYALNSEQIELAHAPDMGWANDEGFVFLRKAGSDAYEARYAAYMENYTPPTPAGYIYNLSVSG